MKRIFKGGEKTWEAVELVLTQAPLLTSDIVEIRNQDPVIAVNVNQLEWLMELFIACCLVTLVLKNEPASFIVVHI